MADEQECKKVIIDIANRATDTFDQRLIYTELVLDNDNQYDVRYVRLDHRGTSAQDVRRLTFSYDIDTGYYIDLNEVTLEYGKDKKAFSRDAIKYIEAFRYNKIKIYERKLFNLIPVRKEVTIIDTE